MRVFKRVLTNLKVTKSKYYDCLPIYLLLCQGKIESKVTEKIWCRNSRDKQAKKKKKEIRNWILNLEFDNL